MTQASEERLERAASPVRGAQRGRTPAPVPGLTLPRAASPHMTYEHALGLQAGIGNRNTSAVLTAASGSGRKLTLGRQRTELSEADVAGITTDPIEQKILRQWMRADVPHHFATRARLIKALRSAKNWHAQSVQPPALFRRANLVFLTSAENREVTLYFVQGDKSGRIRQQHQSGPLAVQEEGNKHYFFSSEEAATEFRRRAEDARFRRTKFIASTHSDLQYSTKASNGKWHVEITRKANGRISQTHRSGGQIVTNIDGYDDAAIAEIYRKATGLGKDQLTVGSWAAEGLKALMAASQSASSSSSARRP